MCVCSCVCFSPSSNVPATHHSLTTPALQSPSCQTEEDEAERELLPLRRTGLQAIRWYVLLSIQAFLSPLLSFFLSFTFSSSFIFLLYFRFLLICLFMFVILINIHSLLLPFHRPSRPTLGLHTSPLFGLIALARRLRHRQGIVHVTQVQIESSHPEPLRQVIHRPASRPDPPLHSLLQLPSVDR